MKISQEAREAWIVCEGYEGQTANAVLSGAHDNVPELRIMQSLINSTLERAAGVAEEHWGNSSAAAHKVTVRSIATAIRQLIEE
jgi:hypothetical protein